MKKIAAAVFLLCFFMSGAAYADGIGVEVDGRTIEFDQPPEMIENRVFIPIRAVSEALGCEVRFYENTKSIGLSDKGESHDSVLLKVGSDKVITIDRCYADSVETMDAVPVIKNNRTLVSLRAVSEALGAEVNWDEESRIVSVKKKYDVSEDGYVYIGSWRNLGVLDKDGNVIIPKGYDSIEFVNGYFVASRYHMAGMPSEIYIFKNDGEAVVNFSVMDSRKLFGYYIMESFDNKYYCISPENSLALNGASEEEFDEFKKENFPFEADYIYDAVDEGSLILAKRGDKYGYVSSGMDKIAIDFRFDKAGDFKGGYAVVKENGVYGIIDESGEYVNERRYAERPDVTDGEEKMVIFPENGFYGVASISGETVLPASYNDIIAVKKDRVIAVNSEGKAGCIGYDGTVLIPFEYVWLWETNEGELYAEKDGKSGYIDEQGNIIIPFIYDNITGVSNGAAMVSRAKEDGESEWAMIDKEGNFLVPFGVFSTDARGFSNGFYPVSFIGWNTSGFVDTNGEKYEASLLWVP